MSWNEFLNNLSEDFLLRRLRELRFTDGGKAVSPGPLDLASLALARNALERPGIYFILEFPRGDHDFAIFLGLFTQLVRMGAKRKQEKTALAFTGPVIIIGMNTQVQERLSLIKIGGIDLEEGLSACRMRSDGRIVDHTGTIQSLQHVCNERVLYLNTRVGWPPLPSGIVPGAIVIDRTSFSDPRIFERALLWADEQRAKLMIVVEDIGDREVKQILEKTNRRFVKWPWSMPLIGELKSKLGNMTSQSRLSTNGLLSQVFKGISGALCNAPAIDALCQSVVAGILMAGKVGEDFPRPLVVARRLFYGLIQCIGTVEEYNQWAAIDHRTTSFNSLKLDLENSNTRDFIGPWRIFAETIWGSLRYDILELYRLIFADPPKLYGIAFLLDQLLRERKDAEIIIRVGSEAAGNALASDLLDLNFDVYRKEGPIQWATMGEKLPWTDRAKIEIYPGAPSPWRISSFWTGESTDRIYLVYPFEMNILQAVLKSNIIDQQQAINNAFTVFRFGAVPPLKWQGELCISFKFDVDRRPRETKPLDVDLNVELGLLFDNIEGEIVRESEIDERGGKLVKAFPITLEPGEEIWWVRENTSVEVFSHGFHKSISADELRVGDEVIVPRGVGRETLFERIVEAVHSQNEVKAYEVFFERWRKACVNVYEHCDCNWRSMEDRMRTEGSKLTYQEYRLWTLGGIIAPLDPEDIARIGRVSKDVLIERQYRRIAVMAKEIRSLHRRLGKILSLAYSDSVAGGGPNLDAIKKIVGGKINVDELFDEFEVRMVRNAGLLKEIAAYKVGKVTKS